ncbi:unnamed protein product [Brassicogethes aeneus]|uniref:Uncharacterized protein n=1 Tax=Brassicogethes aeneus TaxID=1431903 RepID=A0A9P0F9M0_BRAAE|nr:unnamed protein product [Brassicogethes aeneus]
MGIKVDCVRQGHGSTNDGNTARGFFDDPSLSAEITGILLVNGQKIYPIVQLPIGELSEEAQESKNKGIKKFRDPFTTKVNLKRVNTDLFKRLIISSDAYLSSLAIRRKKMNLKSDIRPFILIHENDDGNYDENDEDNDDKNDEENDDENDDDENDDENVDESDDDEEVKG